MNETLSQSIRRAIAGPILSGAWPVGARVPSEHDLMATHQASRMTVNRALSTLAREGLIVRRRGSGTYVAERQPAHAALDIVDVGEEIRRAGRRHSMSVLVKTQGPASAAARELLSVTYGTEVLTLMVLHKADRKPWQVEERFINLALLPPGLMTHATIPYGGWLLRHVPWQEAEHVISAGGANDILAGQLGVERGAPVLLIERRTFIAGKVLTWARLCYGHDHKLVGRFRPAGAG